MLDWKIRQESKGERIENTVPQCSNAVAAWSQLVLTPTVEIVQGVAFDPHEGNEQGLTLSWELFREVLHLCLDPCNRK